MTSSEELRPGIMLLMRGILAELEFLAGGGEMGARMRALDWSKTPLGPPTGWPQSLRTIVRVMLDSRYAMWMLWGPELTFFCNDAYAPTLGVKRDWALGARSDMVWEEIWPDIGPRIAQVLEQGRATWDEALLLFLERSGFTEETYHTFSYSPVYDDDSRIAGMLCVVTEVTERVVGERHLRILKDLATRAVGSSSVEECCRGACEVLAQYPFSIPFAGVYLLDRESHTARLIARTGATPEHVLPEVLDESTHAWPLARLLSTEAAQQVSDLPQAGIEVAASPWPDLVRQVMLLPLKGSGSDRPAGILLAGMSPRERDDERYRAFFELVAGQIAAAITDAQATEADRRRAAALAEIDRAKTAFFSNVSHEFRTPLTLILGPVEEAAVHPGTPPAVRGQLELAHRNSLRLLKLVNSLLDFSRIEAGRVQASYEPTDLAQLTSDLASTFRSAMERAGLAFSVQCDELGEAVYVDREMWEKIVLNLLSNAFKFTLHGNVALRLQRVGMVAVLEIADTGVGVPSHELSRIFERFYRVEGTVGRTQEGSGIGLALVQELVKLHGGTICALSELGRGTTFRVSLPFGTGHLPAERIEAPRTLATTAAGAQAFVQEALRWISANPGESSARLRALTEEPVANRQFAKVAGARILLADDNADMRGYLHDLLSPTYAVEAVADGEQALQAARRDRPDLVVSDIMMPRLDGLALLGLLRADESLRDVPVILLSARAGEEARVEGLDAGADDYLVKPFSARELLGRIGARLELTRMRRENEKRFHAFVSATSDAIYRMSGDWAEMQYLKGRDFIADTEDPSRGWLERYIHPDDQARVMDAVRDAIRAKSIFQLEHRVRRVDGTLGWVFSRAIPLKDESGDIIEWFGAASDVTERKETERALQEREEQLRLATEAAEVGLWDVDLITDTLFWPPRVKAMFGISPDVPVSMADFYAGLHPSDRERITAAFAAALDPQLRALYDVEYRTVGKEDGVIRWVAAKGRGIFDSSGRCVRVIGTAIDISARKRTEEALSDADRRKDEFLAMLAHELRNPLSPISTAGELLSRTIGADSRTQSAVDTIKRQTMQLTRLVDDLLDVSRITQGRIQLRRRPIEVASIINQAVETVTPQLRTKQHRLSILTGSYDPLYVHGDHARLVQCIGNVLANSIKYTDPRGEIRIHTRAEAESAVIEITDTGVGIAPELLPKVFDLFVQGDRTLDRSEGGLGVGLAVVRRLVEMHEGRASARSLGIGAGMTVEIRLPRVARPQASSAESAAIKVPGRRVLIVDDNEDAANSLAALLSLQGHDAQVAFSGRQALDRIASFLPDVALLDLGLPGMDGYELAGQLRVAPQLRGIRIVALTGYGQMEDRHRTRAAGFDDHLVKPVDLSALESAMAGPPVSQAANESSG